MISVIWYTLIDGYHGASLCRFPNGVTALRCSCLRPDELGLKEGDEINVVAATGGIIEVETKEDERRRALERMAERNWTLLPDYKFDRDEAGER